MTVIETIEISDTKRIQIYNDSDPQNPFTDYDTGVNAWVYSDRHMTEYGDIEIPELNRQQIIDNLSDIKALFETTSLKYIVEDYYCTNTDIEDCINDALHDHITNESGSDKLNALAAVLSMAGIKHLNTSGQGYCQGHYHDILLTVSADDVVEEHKEKLLKAVAEEYRCWAYGDVHGYVIEEKCQCCGNWNDSDVSCWGFSGTADSEGYKYMISEAKKQVA